MYMVRNSWTENIVISGKFLGSRVWISSICAFRAFLSTHDLQSSASLFWRLWPRHELFYITDPMSVLHLSLRAMLSPYYVNFWSCSYDVYGFSIRFPSQIAPITQAQIDCCYVKPFFKLVLKLRHMSVVNSKFFSVKLLTILGKVVLLAGTTVEEGH